MDAILNEADAVLRHVLLIRMRDERIGGVELNDQQITELKILGPTVSPTRIHASLAKLKLDDKHKSLAENFLAITFPDMKRPDHHNPFMLYRLFCADMRKYLSNYGFTRAQLILLLEDGSFLGWRHHETRADYEAWGERNRIPRTQIYAKDLLVYEALATHTLQEFKSLFLDELLEEEQEQLHGHCHVAVDNEKTVILSFY
jgi:hypothetical protein